MRFALGIAAIAGIPDLGRRYTRTSTTSQDPGHGPGYETFRWGAVVLERAYVQWQRSARLGVRVGQFLTPYGIWNVDHGTPTLISLYLGRRWRGLGRGRRGLWYDEADLHALAAYRISGTRLEIGRTPVAHRDSTRRAAMPSSA